MTVFTYFDCYDLRFYNKGWGVGERYELSFDSVSAVHCKQ